MFFILDSQTSVSVFQYVQYVNIFLFQAACLLPCDFQQVD